MITTPQPGVVLPPIEDTSFPTAAVVIIAISCYLFFFFIGTLIRKCIVYHEYKICPDCCSCKRLKCCQDDCLLRCAKTCNWKLPSKKDCLNFFFPTRERCEYLCDYFFFEVLTCRVCEWKQCCAKLHCGKCFSKYCDCSSCCTCACKCPSCSCKEWCQYYFNNCRCHCCHHPEIIECCCIEWNTWQCRCRRLRRTNSIDENELIHDLLHVLKLDSEKTQNALRKNPSQRENILLSSLQHSPAAKSGLVQNLLEQRRKRESSPNNSSQLIHENEAIVQTMRSSPLQPFSRYYHPDDNLMNLPRITVENENNDAEAIVSQPSTSTFVELS